MKQGLLSAGALLLLTTSAWASCPAVTQADMMGVAAGAFPQQYDLAEFEEAAGCEMEFSANPDMETLNGEIQGNPELPPPSSSRYRWCIGHPARCSGGNR